MRRVLVAGALIACSIHHHVQLLLGADTATPSGGFLCTTQSGNLQIESAYAAGRLQLAVDVDLIDLGGTLTGGFSTDIIAHCKSVTCTVISRTCIAVDIPFTVGEDPTKALADIEAVLERSPNIVENATDRPVMVRVITARPRAIPVGMPDPTPCDINLDDANTVDLLGCAYSTPVVLDDVNAPIQIGLETQDGVVKDPQVCLAAISACATFPN
jgi:hypothetical protein